MSFPPLIIFFLFFSFKTSCYVSFFSVIKIDQSFCEEDSHLWLINSWGCEQESPIMWVLSFSLKKKNKNKNRKQKYTDIRTRTHTHTRTHKQAHTHVPFDIHVQVWVLCDGMEHSSLPAESCLVGFISCPRPHPAGSWRTHTHTQMQWWHTEPAQLHC